jgi:hypothetical protein
VSELLIPDTITIQVVPLVTAIVLTAVDIRKDTEDEAAAFLYSVAFCLAQAAYPDASVEDAKALAFRLLGKGRDLTKEMAMAAI